MKKSLLEKFKPTLQIQVFLATLFRLQRKLITASDPLELIRPEISLFFWNEDIGILHQLNAEIKNLMQSYPVLEIQQAIKTAISTCEASENNDWSHLFQLTAEFIRRCEPDEDLYYFLLRHQEDCKSTFGRLFLFNLFNRKGLEQTEKFLHDKFHARGFFHLKASVSTHFEGLKQC